ncbi:MAG TPA: hypothetical protein VLB68_22740 [Pyrinomonadaceae bacterium]|nr:hypothetical protein [Pyrinomonadaceae bacterium]
MAQPHSYLKLVGHGLTIIPIPPFEISRSSELEIPLLVKREGSSIVIRHDSDQVDSELVEVSVGPDEPWRLVTSLYKLAWPRDFAIVSSPTPDVPPGFDLLGPGWSLVYLQGPFASERVKHGEHLAAPGQKMIENRVFATIERAWFEYRFEGEDYFQVHHLVELEGRVLMITLQVLSAVCDDDLLQKVLALASSAEPYS